MYCESRQAQWWFAAVTVCSPADGISPRKGQRCEMCRCRCAQCGRVVCRLASGTTPIMLKPKPRDWTLSRIGLLDLWRTCKSPCSPSSCCFRLGIALHMQGGSGVWMGGDLAGHVAVMIKPTSSRHVFVRPYKVAKMTLSARWLRTPTDAILARCEDAVSSM